MRHGGDDGVFVRRTIDDPTVIAFAPAEFGYMTAEDVRNHALSATPGTLQWDCFTFGIVEHADYFTCYASIDHLHVTASPPD